MSEYTGEKLKDLRKRARLSQMQVVALTGVTETTIHNAEHNKRRPQNATLEKLLNLYAIRIAKYERLSKVWPDGGPVPEDGMVKGDRAAVRGDKKKSPPRVAGVGIQAPTTGVVEMAKSRTDEEKGKGE